MQFLDTNIFVRYFTRDDPVKTEQCTRLLNEIAAGKVNAITTDAVLLELEHVLTSKALYAISRNTVASIIQAILDFPNLVVTNHEEHQDAVICYQSNNIDYTDCLIVAQANARGIAEIVSFDRDFDRFSEIHRIEPRKSG